MSKSFAFLCALIFAISCGKFTVSPYVSNTPSSKLNSKQLSSIKAQEPGADQSFKIAVISDTHNYYKELEEQIDYINKHRSEYAFVLIGGDLTNLGLLREFETTKKLLQNLNLPYLSAIGNHDLLSNGGDVFEQMFGADNFSFTYNQTKFIIFNNNNWESSGKVPDLNYVESEMLSSTSTYNILIGHVSPLDKDRWTETDKQEMGTLFRTYDVDYFLNGHDHNPGDEAYEGGTRVTIGASSKRKILEVEFASGGAGVSHNFINL